MQKKLKNRGKLRLWVQIGAFAVVEILALVKWLKELGVSIPFFPEISLHAVCPFGGVVTLYDFATTGALLPKLHSAALILMFLGLFVALFFGPLFCGYICPLGSFQEWIGKLGRKLFPKRYGKLISPKVDRVLGYLRYGVLAAVVYQTAVVGKLVFQDVDPYYALFNFLTGEVAVTALVVLLLVMVLSLFVERPWCRYLCPYGALLGLFNLIRIFPVRRKASTCIHCGKCDKACPMNIPVSQKAAVRDPRCISCYECVSGNACPVNDTVTISTSKGGNAQ
ncbi:MAG TPA: 4Fe-4S binding protein [Candidatus Limiplasma sp.]|nr:4Fe-4S binding protein [Candidatus Limiplasma sp.]HPS82400.1 4Fe-4S binding protein [Candidatus Limiplasma sp.]